LVVVNSLRAARRGPPRQRTPEQQYEAQQLSRWGFVNAAMVCPHCQEKGQVRTQPITRKKGVSGAKATGAILTGGLSLLATGLSWKEIDTAAHCSRCGSTWHF